MTLCPGQIGALRTYWVIPCVIAWKLSLIVLFTLPLPANDAFFFDGAVIHFLEHGGYYNPSIVRMFPISGAEFFSAYPPGYQSFVFAWMSLVGTSVQASVLLHGLLFSAHACVLLALFVHLRLPAGAGNLGAAFLLAVTFHDRPDSVAQFFGICAVYAWLRGWRGVSVSAAVGSWLSSLHIGAMYVTCLWLLAYLQFRRGETRLPWRPLLAMPLVTAAIFAGIVAYWPIAWEGFLENLRVTPSLTGFRLPAFEEVLKVGRAVPGLTLVILAFSLVFRRKIETTECELSGAFLAVAIAAGIAVVATLTVVSPNYVHAPAYLQPLAVALGLTCLRAGASDRWWRRLNYALMLALLLAGIRAVGLSTWGVAAAIDMGRNDAEKRIRAEVGAMPDAAEIMVSSAYLYALADQERVRSVHSDWIAAIDGVSIYGAEAPFRPSLVVLTPFDYYRRYQIVLRELESQGRVKITRLDLTGRVPPPDRFPAIQRVVQHLSWAPVIMELEWR